MPSKFRSHGNLLSNKYLLNKTFDAFYLFELIFLLFVPKFSNGSYIKFDHYLNKVWHIKTTEHTLLERKHFRRNYLFSFSFAVVFHVQHEVTYMFCAFSSPECQWGTTVVNDFFLYSSDIIVPNHGLNVFS